MESFLKKSGWTSVVTSIVFVILGIVLMLNPNGVLKIVSVVLATLFIIFGIIKIIEYFSAKGNYNFYNYDFIYGVISIIAGIVTLFCMGAIEAIFRWIIGIWIIYSGVMRLDFAFKLKSMELSTWITVFVIAVLMLACGIFILANQGAILTTLGILLLVYAVMDLVESMIFIKNVKELF